jgi:hypothetical protein
MKRKTPLVMALIATVFTISCSDDNVKKKPLVLPEKMESTDSKVEFSYDPDNNVTAVTSSYYYPNDVVLVTNYAYTYTTEGNYKQCLVDNGYRFDYTYEDDKLVRTDEYIDDSFTQYHSFTYNAEGRVTEILTWQDIPEEGGWIPVSKSTYAYNGDSNVTQQKLYYYNSGTKEHHLQTSFNYNGYDSEVSVEGLFANLTANPAIKLSKNNPLKITTSNGNGIMSFTVDFTYSYDDLGYIVSRSIESTVLSTGEKSTNAQNFTYLER